MTDCKNFVLDQCVCHDFGEPKGQCANCGAYDYEHTRDAFQSPKSVDVTITIERCEDMHCNSKCPYHDTAFGPGGISICQHIAFKKTKPYENAILLRDDERFPEGCPLMPWNNIEAPQ